MRRKLRFGVLAVTLAAVATAATAWAGAGHRQVLMLDACDGPSFNAVIGEGTCSRAGGVTFERFIDQLLTHGEAPSWRNSPEQLKLDAGGTISAPNRGGEFHTFTEVAAFGGGCVPDLNALLGLSPVPECGIPGIFGTTGAPPGGVVTTGALAPGTHRFMCLIHPWMRSTVEVG
ncbi:MAG: cupredoxin domain-containing protein [Gaiellaceae bacterium]